MWRGLPLRAWGEGVREFESLCRFGVLYLLQLLSVLERVTVCWFFSSQLSLLQLAKSLFLSLDVSILELENLFLIWEVFVLEWTSVCWFFSSQLSVLQLEVSVLELEVSVLELEVSVLELEVSVLELEVSVLDLEVTVLELEVSVLDLEVSVLELVNLFLICEVPAFVFCDFAFHVIVLILLVSIRLVLIWFELLVVAGVVFVNCFNIFLSRCVFCYQSLFYFVGLKNKV